MQSQVNKELKEGTISNSVEERSKEVSEEKTTELSMKQSEKQLEKIMEVETKEKRVNERIIQIAQIKNVDK